MTGWVKVNGRWTHPDLTARATMNSEEDCDDEVLRANVALCGVQSYLKMLIWDNFVHADLHPGNVLVRMEDIGPLARLQRWLVTGETASRVPHIIFLDAGLAASFDSRISGNVRAFFSSILRFDGDKFGDAVLGLSETQPLRRR